MKSSVLTAIALLGLVGPAVAQEHQHHPGGAPAPQTQAQPQAPAQPQNNGHAGHNAITPATAQADTPATLAFRDINARMHRDMDIRYTNDIDVDFVRNMIPHHLAAVEMAKVVLLHSQEPETRKLAEDVVRAQEAEIAQMRAFLKKKGVE
jgi:uncharacterized protein (DUF305 family)